MRVQNRTFLSYGGEYLNQFPEARLEDLNLQTGDTLILEDDPSDPAAPNGPACGIDLDFSESQDGSGNDDFAWGDFWLLTVIFINFCLDVTLVTLVFAALKAWREDVFLNAES